MFIRQHHRVSLFPFVQYQIGLRLVEGLLVPFSLKYLEGGCGNKSWEQCELIERLLNEDG
jgi:hypothetical protein